jgi:type II secretory pathway predicted ATPase ExeA
MTAYWTTLGLSGPPCSKEVEDPDLWLPPSKQRLVDDLEEALREKSQVLLVGEPGVGKTCVLRALRSRLNQPNMRLTYCHNATLGRRDFYRQLCLAIGLTPNATAAAVFHGVTTHVQELGRERVYPVFLLDEAHLLHQDTLDHLHILLNYEWDRAALLSLVLVGLPELRDRLQLRRNRSLLSRIHARFTIEPTTPEDTADYLRTRLAKVGCDRDLFADEAIAMLHEAAVGSMRDIDRLATGALKEIVKRKKKLVERETIARVIDQDRLAIE